MDMTNCNAAFVAALAAAQGEIENAVKGSVNPAFRSKYADLAEVLNTCRPVLSKHHIAIIQSTAFDGSMVHVTTTLAHKDGGYVSAKASAVPAKTDGQGIGSCTTYLRRYQLAAMTAIGQEDDDGNSAQHAGKPAPTRTSAGQGQDRSLPGIDKWLDARQALRDASNMSELGAIWRDLSAEARKVLAQEKDAAKTRLAASEASTEAAP